MVNNDDVSPNLIFKSSARFGQIFCCEDIYVYFVYIQSGDFDCTFVVIIDDYTKHNFSIN